VVERDEHGMLAEIASLRRHPPEFTTRNSTSPERGSREAGERAVVELDGHWNFHGRSARRRAGLPDQLELTYGFQNMGAGGAGRTGVRQIASTMVDAFVKLAEQVYG